MPKHWWDRSRREQKHLRRWCREPLASNLRARAVARAHRRQQEQEARREARTECEVCHGHGQLVRGLGTFNARTVPCHGCRPHRAQVEAMREEVERGDG